MAHDAFDYIRKQYDVQVQKGSRVVAHGSPGVVTGARGAYLLIKLDGEALSDIYHPTHGIEYQTEQSGKE